MALKEELTEKVGVSVSKREKTIWQHAASAEGKALSVFVRDAVNLYLKVKKKAGK